MHILSQEYKGKKSEDARRVNNKQKHVLQLNDLYFSNRLLPVNVGKNGSYESTQYKTFM